MPDIPCLQAGPDAIDEAARRLRAGELVAFPTETVYGLGGNATDGRAVAAIFAAKNRPEFNPLIIHLPDAEAAARLVDFDRRAERLAAAFWPGPLTLVLPRSAGCPVHPLASAGLGSLAVRVPGHPVALALLAACGVPLAAPSANPSGRLSPTEARHVAEGLGGGVALILDGGRCAVGVESTVVDLTGDTPVLLRPGGVAREALQDAVGPLAAATPGGSLRSPGLLTSHYAPDRPLRLGAVTVGAGEALLAFGAAVPEGAAACLNLSQTGNLEEAAANLFSYLRRLDRPEHRAIAVAPIPEHGLGLAINDRLRRAAAPRA